MRRTLAPSSLGAVALAMALAVGAAASWFSGPVPAVLVGWALLPADTFSDGPTSGQRARANPYGTLRPPYPNRQPVQGFSAVLRGADDASFVVMTDNGFGARDDSADFLLRMYSVRPDFRTARGGTGTVRPGDYRQGVSLHNYTAASRVALRDPDRRLGFPIQAQFEHEYDDPARPPVAPSIRRGRLLTGADLDVEAVRLDRDCHYWFGDEIGPYLVETDLSGAVLRAEIPIPGVFSPESGAVRAGAAVANLPRSGGIEGLAINARGDRLYTLLEKAVAGDGRRLRRLQEFDVARASFTGATWFYPMERAGLSAAELTAVDDTHFLVIERNDDTGTEGRPFKKIFLASIDGVENGGRVVKTELVDLMKVADPDDLDGDGKATFSFPYATTEAVLVLDARTLLVMNDDNFPEGGGRAARADDTEFVKIRLDRRLPGFVRRPAGARACFEAGR
jgi:hypothetical protein